MLDDNTTLDQVGLKLVTDIKNALGVYTIDLCSNCSRCPPYCTSSTAIHGTNGNESSVVICDEFAEFTIIGLAGNRMPIPPQLAIKILNLCDTCTDCADTCSSICNTGTSKMQGKNLEKHSSNIYRCNSYVEKKD